MTRRELRKHLVRLLFLREFHEADEIDEQNQLYFDVLLPNEGAKTENSDATGTVFEKYGRITEKLPEIDGILTSEMLKWNLKRVGIVERNILRLALFEIMYDEIPPAVAINEAVNLSKEFGGEQSPGFVNGVLAKIVNKKSKDNE